MSQDEEHWRQHVASAIVLGTVIDPQERTTAGSALTATSSETCSGKLEVDLKTKNSALDPEIYAHLQDADSREAFLHYSQLYANQKDLRDLMLQRRMDITRRLRDRESGKIRANRSAQSRKKVKFVLAQHEEAHIKQLLRRNRWTTAKRGDPRMAQLIGPLGGFGLVDFEIIVSKWVDNNARKVLANVDKEAPTSESLASELDELLA